MSRRTVLAALAAAGGGLGTRTAAQGAPVIHWHEQTVPFPVNAFVVEGADGLVTVDATLTVESATTMKALVDGLGKPLRGMLLTHPHPDHYAGLALLKGERDVPVISVEGVRAVTLRDDAAKDAMIGGMFGDAWPAERIAPDTVARDDEVLDFGPDLRFGVVDIGPAESHHDSAFVLEGTDAVFVGDLAYAGMHSYMADVHNPDWLAAIDRLSGELAGRRLLVGHGPEGRVELLRGQQGYIRAFDAALDAADWSDADAAAAEVTAAMLRLLPAEDLLFLMQLSIAPNAAARGLI